MIKGSDSFEMENQITSMLEQVLKVDSEGETSILTAPQEIRRKNKISFEVLKNEKNPRHFTRGDTRHLTTPRILINSQPYIEDNENNYNQFVNEMRNIPLQNQRSKGSSAISNKNAHLGKGINANFLNTSNSGNFSQMSSSCSSSTYTSYIQQNPMTQENVHALITHNEFDEIFELKVRTQEKLNEECYDKLKGSFFKIITSQNGSRVLQKVLKNTSKEILSKIFYEIEERIADLMIDSYANYFCQKFFSMLFVEERRRFLIQIRLHVIEIGNSKVGTYPLQAIVDLLETTEEKSFFIDSIINKVIIMSLDAQGTHVIEKMLTAFGEESIQHIYKAIIKEFIMLSVSVNGLCVVKKTIIHAENIETLSIIREYLAQYALYLIQNPFGNYALQIAFEYWSYEFCLPIVEKFFGHFFELSLQKYSSNVIEKCFRKNEDFIISAFINEVCQDYKITDLMRNSYGNYVVQKALKVATGINKITLTNCIKSNLERLSDKKLVNKWKSIVSNSMHLGVFSNEMNSSGLNISGSSNDSSRSINSLRVVPISLSPVYSPSQQMMKSGRANSSLSYQTNNMNNNLLNINPNNLAVPHVHAMYKSNSPNSVGINGNNFFINY